MKGFTTISNIVKYSIYTYLTASLFYSTLHLLGWFQTPAKSLQPRSALTISQLQSKYNTTQIASWSNDKGYLSLFLLTRLILSHKQVE
jgi:hypothetical protein